jgi:hypothetical protein
MKNLSEYSRSPGRESNLEPLKMDTIINHHETTFGSWNMNMKWVCGSHDIGIGRDYCPLTKRSRENLLEARERVPSEMQILA